LHIRRLIVTVPSLPAELFKSSRFFRCATICQLGSDFQACRSASLFPVFVHSIGECRLCAEVRSIVHDDFAGSRYMMYQHVKRGLYDISCSILIGRVASIWVVCGIAAFWSDVASFGPLVSLSSLICVLHGLGDLWTYPRFGSRQFTDARR